MLRALFALCLLCLSSLVGAQSPLAVPALSARVIDQTATLSADQRARLETRLSAFERQKGAQIAVLIVASVGPETVEQYALRVVEAWKLGRHGVDDGALLLVAKNDRKLRIEVGYGLEGALNDATAKRIISETIAPRFKDGDFFGGIDAGVEAMIKVVGGEPLPPPKATSSGAGIDFETLIGLGFIAVFVVGGILRAIFGRFLGAGVVGVVAGIVASLLVSSLLLGVLAGIVAFIVSLFAGVSGLGGWSSGGMRGGGFSGGGFSGGGGSFGGGGASGGW
ncbi:MAG: hypothetical protein H6R17_3843 [Proteobacteria bacterium]|nr:hypothetical protein [Pseudomonadota bacterium]